MEKKKTNAKILTEEVNELIYSIDDYVKGDIKTFNTKIVTLDCTEEDLFNSLNESIIFRQYFKAKDNNLTVPVFFTCIEGVSRDVRNYFKIFNACENVDNCIFIDNINKLLNEKFDNSNKLNALKNTIGSVLNLTDIKYSKYFIKSQNKFNVENIINSHDKELSKYPVNLQKYLINKLNDYINSSAINGTIEESDKFKLLHLISNLKGDFILKLSNFNVEKVSPKIILFLQEEERLTNIQRLFLGYLHNLAVDIIIFTPAGLANLELSLKSNIFSKIRLDYVDNSIKGSLVIKVNSYLNKYKISASRLDESFQVIGYNGPLNKYKKSIKILRHPILYKIRRFIAKKLSNWFGN